MAVNRRELSLPSISIPRISSSDLLIDYGSDYAFDFD